MYSQIRELTSPNKSNPQLLEDRLDTVLKISPNLKPDFVQEIEGKASNFSKEVQRDSSTSIETANETETASVTDETSVSASPCPKEDDETARVTVEEWIFALPCPKAASDTNDHRISALPCPKVDNETATNDTWISALPCPKADDETASVTDEAWISALPSLGQLDATTNDDEDDGFKTPTSLEHRIPTPTECPPAPKKKKRPRSPIVQPRRGRRKLFPAGFDDLVFL